MGPKVATGGVVSTRLARGAGSAVATTDSFRDDPTGSLITHSLRRHYPEQVHGVALTVTNTAKTSQPESSPVSRPPIYEVTSRFSTHTGLGPGRQASDGVPVQAPRLAA